MEELGKSEGEAIPSEEKAKGLIKGLPFGK
jgi:hypothetical protein